MNDEIGLDTSPRPSPRSKRTGSGRKATINSRQKGKRGERLWRDELRANGYHARRGQQFSGSPDSPDVICEELAWAHFEVKLVEHLNLSAAMAQARRDAAGKAAFVAHRKNFWPWLVTFEAERFYRFLRCDLTGEWAVRMASGCSPADACRELEWIHCQLITGRRLNIHEAVRHVKRTSGKRIGVVAHPDRDGRWLVTVPAETFFNFLRWELPLQGSAPVALGSKRGKTNNNSEQQEQ